MKIEWVWREPPLRAVAVTGAGRTAGALAGGVRSAIARGAELRVSAGAGHIVVLGETDDLPWADGATYLGRDAGLLMPTTRRPVLPAALLRDRLLGGGSEGRLVVVLPGDEVLVSAVPVRPVAPEQLDGMYP